MYWIMKMRIRSYFCTLEITGHIILNCKYKQSRHWTQWQSSSCSLKNGINFCDWHRNNRVQRHWPLSHGQSRKGVGESGKETSTHIRQPWLWPQVSLLTLLTSSRIQSSICSNTTPRIRSSRGSHLCALYIYIHITFTIHTSALTPNCCWWFSLSH